MSAIREEATIHDAYIQITTRYQRGIPELFKYNAFCVISDGANSRAGSFFAKNEFWYPWRVASHNPHPQPLSQGEKGVNYRGGFEYASLVKRARELRDNQTPAEADFVEHYEKRVEEGSTVAGKTTSKPN